MSVKETQDLTRQEAEQKFFDLYTTHKRHKIMAKAARLSDTELEDLLEKWNDEFHGGEGFENYLIRKDQP